MSFEREPVPAWFSHIQVMGYVPHLLRRWTTFNAVGAMGVAVQLGLLAVLVHWSSLNYLAATIIALEAALIHNFLWHQHWTWRDRPAATMRAIAGRFIRFHATNGVVSLVGNIALMAALTGVLGLDPVLANAAAIVSCSLINFAAGTTFVFRTAVLLAPLFILGPAASVSAEPGSDTLESWKVYQASIEARHSAAAADARRFFLQDLLPGTAGWRAAALRGEVPVTGLDAVNIPGGTIHHWAGAVLVPGVTLDQFLGKLLSQAGAEDRFYEDVVASKLLARDGDRLRVFMKLRRKTVLTVTYNTEHAVEYRRLGARRASSRSIATRIAELANAGTATEREKPPGSDYGFLWRLNAYWRYEQTPAGVLIECESVSLSRRVPAVARLVVSPVIARVARESLVRTLQAVRAAVLRADA